MNMKERVKTHAFEPIKRTLKDRNGEEHEFEFHPLPNKYWIDLMYIAMEIEDGRSKGEAMMTKDQMQEMARLVGIMVKESYPNWEENEIDHFVGFHLGELVMLMQEMHSQTRKTNPAAEKAKELREKKNG